MSEFVIIETAEDNDDVTLENESCEGETMSDVDVDFIDDTEYTEIVKNSQEPSNYCSDDEIWNEVTEFKDFIRFLCHFICNQVHLTEKSDPCENDNE